VEHEQVDGQPVRGRVQDQPRARGVAAQRRAAARRLDQRREILDLALHA
jgi:hypothetical protein